MKFGFVICSRSNSTRLPNKPFIKINNLPVIEHLIQRLEPCGLPIIIAVPLSDMNKYAHLSHKYTSVSVYLDDINMENPLGRMYFAAESNKLDAVIRVTHDKIFVDPNEVNKAIYFYKFKKLDYLYSSTFVPGTGFEIISFASLKEAAGRFKNVEFIGYAIRSVTSNIHNYINDNRHRNNIRLLIDYPEDRRLMDIIFANLNNDCLNSEVFSYLNDNKEFNQINKLPELTIYTCTYNSKKWLTECFESVHRQKDFRNYEYIIIDDCSTDGSLELIAKFALKYPNVKWIRNQTNLGLASSSNIALKEARGKYILRIDADDFLIQEIAMQEMLKRIKNSDKEVIYPDNYFGSLKKVQKGNVHHHIGGAMFDRNAVNHIKFTDGLRGYEGLDFFVRAKGQLKVGYYEKPIFFYRQHEGNMSKHNLDEREKIKNDILSAGNGN